MVELPVKGGQPFATAMGEKTIVADFDKAPGQDVLKKAADELKSRQGGGSELAGVGGAEAEGDPAIGEFQDAVVADGDAKDVGSQVLEGGET